MNWRILMEKGNINQVKQILGIHKTWNPGPIIFNYFSGDEG
jgi:hypothetical protein